MCSHTSRPPWTPKTSMVCPGRCVLTLSGRTVGSLQARIQSPLQGTSRSIPRDVRVTMGCQASSWLWMLENVLNLLSKSNGDDFCRGQRTHVPESHMQCRMIGMGNPSTEAPKSSWPQLNRGPQINMCDETYVLFFIWGPTGRENKCNLDTHIIKYLSSMSNLTISCDMMSKAPFSNPAVPAIMWYVYRSFVIHGYFYI